MNKKNVKTESKELAKKIDIKKTSSFKKKKKVNKNISSGIAYVYSTFNNTIISIADENGNVISWSSAGAKGFKGSRKSTPYAAQVAADDAGSSFRTRLKDSNCSSKRTWFWKRNSLKIFTINWIQNFIN